MELFIAGAAARLLPDRPAGRRQRRPQTVAAEAAGFDTARYARHHFNNYSLRPSPLSMVAHIVATQSRDGAPIVTLLHDELRNVSAPVEFSRTP